MNYTKREWKVNNKNQVESRNRMGRLLFRWEQFTPKDMINTSETNAKLIAEAGTVANETGKTPRQLADINTGLLEACKKAQTLITEMHNELRSKEKKGDPMHVYPVFTDGVLEQAINKAE